MSDTSTKAKFWKCALQVNTSDYMLAYRGTGHNLTPDQYNKELVRVALEHDIKVIGLADHGNVDGVEAIRTTMKHHGILVFPGFEIATTEKVHFVCLFSEDTTTTQLDRYLGALGLTDPDNGSWPSNLGANNLLDKVNELGGLTYAAHCTSHSGVLLNKLAHIWKNPLLKAAQIPGTIDDLKNHNSFSYRRIILNKDPAYHRDIPLGIINAKDVAVPKDLANPQASCLIKMTKPCFESFKLAFSDPESRVRLCSDVTEKHYSLIEQMTITGGYLDGITVEFSDHLNAVIGGRGSGKSTLLECIRYCLDKPPTGQNAARLHREIIKENIGKTRARVQLILRSAKMNGRRFTIARRYGEDAVVEDEHGKISSFTPNELLSEVEIYGQNEIHEIATDRNGQRTLLGRFQESTCADVDKRIQEALEKLKVNRKKLLKIRNDISTMEDEVALLPKFREQADQFKTLGLEDKLKIVPLLEMEKRLLNRVREEEVPNLNKAFRTVRDNIPDTTFLNDKVLAPLPHAEGLRKIRSTLDRLRVDAELLLDQWQKSYATMHEKNSSLISQLNETIQLEEKSLEKTFKELPSSRGKTGRQIGIEFQELMKKIEKIRPKETLIANLKNLQKELEENRQKILAELSTHQAGRSARFQKSIRGLNKRLKGKLRLKLTTDTDRGEIINHLLACKLENIGSARLAWINSADPFPPVRLAALIREGADALLEADWGITPSVANALTRLTREQLLKLEEIDLLDSFKIELNTAHPGLEEHYKPLDKLSTGQQCTAILHLLLLHNPDPLIMDQPEDNLDNAFIADRIVAELRSAKISRQFIFATHNANIPIFGDAEWIGILNATDEQAQMPPHHQGGIDIPEIRDNAAEILEGGKAAFNQRKAKYGF